MKKRIFTLMILISIGINSFALPGVKSFINDTSGEYVFYKDFSFTKESYIGIIYYNDSTYALRYYSPVNKKNITTYITVNPKSENLEFTGEKIVGITSGDDSAIVNYLHDIFYELNSRRKKLNEEIFNSKDKNFSSNQIYEQFGGSVELTFNNLIPIFNLESIRKANGDYLLQLQTIGLLTDSKDSSFDNFQGFEKENYNAKKSKKIKKTEMKIFDVLDKKIQLDQNWTQSMENLFFLKEDALLMLNEVSVPESLSPEMFKIILTRQFIQSTATSYADWQYSSIKNLDNNVIKISNIFFQPQSKNITRDFKILKQNEDGKFTLMTLTIFDSIYKKNKKYFDLILENYISK